MAQSATTDFAPSEGLFTRAVNGVGRALVYVAENNPRYQQLKAIREMSDAELTARGTTRADVVRRVFADRFYL